MYYVVYLKEASRYAVLPCRWVKGGDSTILQKFVNKGLNSNQTHICYYSNEVDEEDYAALRAHRPNFGARISNVYPCDEDEAIYHCFVLKFICKCSVTNIFIAQSS